MKPKKKPDKRRIRPMTKKEEEALSIALACRIIEMTIALDPKLTFDDIATMANNAGYSLSISLKPK